MIQGSCLCGGVKFEIDERHTLIINNCHVGAAHPHVMFYSDANTALLDAPLNVGVRRHRADVFKPANLCLILGLAAMNGMG